MNTWYAKTINKDSAHEQGLIIDENTGANIAITLDPKDAILAAAAPELLEALKAAEAKLNQIAGVYGARLDGTELETSKVCNLIVAAILKAEG